MVVNACDERGIPEHVQTALALTDSALLAFGKICPGLTQGADNGTLRIRVRRGPEGGRAAPPRNSGNNRHTCV